MEFFYFYIIRKGIFFFLGSDEIRYRNIVYVRIRGFVFFILRVLRLEIVVFIFWILIMEKI